jgi:hypothetical protein
MIMVHPSSALLQCCCDAVFLLEWPSNYLNHKNVKEIFESNLFGCLKKLTYFSTATKKPTIFYWYFWIILRNINKEQKEIFLDQLRLQRLLDPFLPTFQMKYCSLDVKSVNQLNPAMIENSI